MNIASKGSHLIVLVIAMSCARAETINFEPDDGYAAASDPSSRAGWTASTKGVARISDEFSNGGNQSLEMLRSGADRSLSRNFPLPKSGVVFVDFQIRPPADSQENPPYTLSVNGAILGFIKTGAQGTVVALPNGRPESVATGFVFDVDEQDLARDWIRVTIRENLKTKSWDLFLDGKLTLVDQPLASPSSKEGTITAYSSPAGSTFLDDLSVASVNPLFPDADQDGLPDAEEVANGSNPFYDDRETDLNQDGLSNVQSFRQGKSLSATSTKNLRLIYIDNLHGDDSAAGVKSYASQSEGPKRTIRGASRIKDPHLAYVLMPSSQPYVCPDYPNGTAPDVTYIMTTSNITITGESK